MRSLSKHRMKLRRYRLSGATHSSGIGATFWVRWLVVASRSVDAHPASPTHRAMVAMLGGGPAGYSSLRAGSILPLTSSARLRQPAHPHTRAKATNAPDHTCAWLVNVIRGSTSV